MQKIRFVNGNGVEIDLTSGNYGITAISGLSNANLNLQTQQVPNNDGSVYIDSLLDNRTIDMTVALNDENDLEKRYQLRRELISVLNPKLGEGYLYYKNDFLERRIKVIPNPPVIKNKNSNEKGTVKASVSFTACGVYWEDVEETVVELNSFEEKTVVNNGDVPCAVKIEADTWNVNNFSIRNDVTDSKIILNDISDSEKIIINTEMGQKSVESLEILLRSESSFSPALYHNGYYYTSLYRSKDCINWDCLDIPYNYSSSNICYSTPLDIFVVVVDKNIFTSTDGEIWNKGEQTFSNDINKIIYCEELSIFVAVGAGVIYTSSNGITWVSRIASGILEDVVYSSESNLFVAVGASGVILTSSDGITWTSQSSGTTSILWRVAFGKTLGFVAVGASGVILTSSDGITWTSQSSGTSNTLLSVIYVDTLSWYIVPVNSGILINKGFGWEAQSKGGNYVFFSKEVGKIFLNSNNGLFTSENGEDWTLLTRRGVITGFTGITYSKKLKRIVAVTVSGKIYYKSDDQWNVASMSPTNSNILRDVTYSEELELFVAVGLYGTIYSSVNGISWNKVTVSASNIFRILYISNLHKFIATSQGSVLLSSDGINWENYNVSSSTTDWFEYIAYSPVTGKIIIPNYETVYSSDDGETWNATTLVNDYITDVVYCDSSEKFFGINHNDTAHGVLVSVDGITWNKISTQTMLRIFYLKDFDKFIGYFGPVDVADRTTPYCIYFSSDGINWSSPIYGKIDGQRITSGSCIYISEEDKFYLSFNYIYSSCFRGHKNIINKLDPVSDINFKLELGDNILNIYNVNKLVPARLTYRQKYLGV